MDILDTQVPFVAVVLLISGIYFILVIIIFYICTRIQPHKFVQVHKAHRSEDGTVQGMPLSYLDCSIVLKCCPCPDFSFRQFLKSCCCDSEKLRRNVNCECMRPAVHGSQRSEGLNLVCCQPANSD